MNRLMLSYLTAAKVKDGTASYFPGRILSTGREKFTRFHWI
jgi:hypothetical protein